MNEGNFLLIYIHTMLCKKGVSLDELDKDLSSKKDRQVREFFPDIVKEFQQYSVYSESQIWEEILQSVYESYLIYIVIQTRAKGKSPSQVAQSSLFSGRILLETSASLANPHQIQLVKERGLKMTIRNAFAASLNYNNATVMNVLSKIRNTSFDQKVASGEILGQTVTGVEDMKEEEQVREYDPIESLKEIKGKELESITRPLFETSNTFKNYGVFNAIQTVVADKLVANFNNTAVDLKMSYDDTPYDQDIVQIWGRMPSNAQRPQIKTKLKAMVKENLDLIKDYKTTGHLRELANRMMQMMNELDLDSASRATSKLKLDHMNDRELQGRYKGIFGSKKIFKPGDTGVGSDEKLSRYLMAFVAAGRLYSHLDRVGLSPLVIHPALFMYGDVSGKFTDLHDLVMNNRAYCEVLLNHIKEHKDPVGHDNLILNTDEDARWVKSYLLQRTEWYKVLFKMNLNSDWNFDLNDDEEIDATMFMYLITQDLAPQVGSYDWAWLGYTPDHLHNLSRVPKLKAGAIEKLEEEQNIGIPVMKEDATMFYPLLRDIDEDLKDTYKNFEIGKRAQIMYRLLAGVHKIRHEVERDIPLASIEKASSAELNLFLLDNSLSQLIGYGEIDIPYEEFVKRVLGKTQDMFEDHEYEEEDLEWILTTAQRIPGKTQEIVSTVRNFYERFKELVFSTKETLFDVVPQAFRPKVTSLELLYKKAVEVGATDIRHELLTQIVNNRNLEVEPETQYYVDKNTKEFFTSTIDGRVAFLHSFGLWVIDIDKIKPVEKATSLNRKEKATNAAIRTRIQDGQLEAATQQIENKQALLDSKVS